MITCNDARLVEDSLTGNREAFGAIVDRYRGLIAGVTYNQCGNLTQSEDLAQETFLIAWRDLSRLSDPARLSAWLCGIARNVSRSARRKLSRHESSVPLVDSHFIADEQPGPTHSAISREQQAHLWETLEQLPEQYREALILFYRQQQSISDVASALGLSEPAVRKRLERGRKLLRRELAKFVEDALEQTVPRETFCAVVVAALPAISAPSMLSAGAAGAGATTKAIGLLPLLGMFAGPVIGVLGSSLGWLANVRNARTPRERRLIFRGGLFLQACIVVFIILNAVTIVLGPSYLSRDGFVAALIGQWTIYFAFLITFVIKLERRRRQILKEDGVPESRSPVSTYQSQPWKFTWAIGGAVFGATAWMLGMAMVRGDWLSVAIITSTDVGLCLIALRRVKQNPMRWISTVFLLDTGILLLTAIMTNLRLHDWIGIQAADLPLWGLNLFLLVVWIGTSAVIVMSRNPSASSPASDGK